MTPVRDAQIHEKLSRALEMTEAVLDGAVTTASVHALLAKRAPLLSSAFDARRAGVAWGNDESAIADAIMRCDRALVKALWQPRKDAFLWLAARREKLEIEMPHVSALAAVTQTTTSAPPPAS